MINGTYLEGGLLHAHILSSFFLPHSLSWFSRRLQSLFLKELSDFAKSGQIGFLQPVGKVKEKNAGKREEEEERERDKKKGRAYERV